MSFYLHVSHNFDEGLAFTRLFVGFAQSRICHAGYVLMGAYNSLQSAQIHWYKYISEASFVAVFNAPTPTSPPLLVWDIHSESDGHAANGDETPL